jgi:dihydrolipoamide dehydrogenase
VAAIRAAQMGLKTAVVEKDELGGTCLNWGCIPTKSWIVTAHLYEQIKRAKEYGIIVGEPQIDWSALVARKNKIVKQLTGGVKQLLSGRQVDILKGTARLTAANRIAIAASDGGTSEITTGQRHPRHRCVRVESARLVARRRARHRQQGGAGPQQAAQADRHPRRAA